MLELAGGVGLGVYVGYLLQLQSPFERNGVMDTAPQEEGVLLIGKTLGHLLDIPVQLQGLPDLRRQAAQLGDELALDLGRHAASAAEGDAEQHQGHQLGGERLGRCDAYLRARMRHEHQITLAHERALGHVADCETVVESKALRLRQRGQGVRRLPRLGYGHNQCAARHHVGPVAKLARDFDVAGYGEALQPVLGDETGVVAGAASDDLNAPDRVEDGAAIGAERALEEPRSAQTRFQGIGHGTSLLEDLLVHVVAVLTELDGIGFQGADSERALHALTGTVVDADLARADIHHITVVQGNETLRDLHQRGNVGGDECLPVSDPDDKRAAAACADHTIGLVGTDDADGVGSLEIRNGRLHRMQQVQALLQIAVYLMDDDLGVRLGRELVALRQLPLTQALEILDDAVAHDRHPLPANVRVGVAEARFAVRRPARVRDARAAVQRLLDSKHLLELLHPTHRTRAGETVIFLNYRQSGGVVASILQPSQSVDQHRDDVALRHRAHYSAHGIILPDVITG